MSEYMQSTFESAVNAISNKTELLMLLLKLNISSFMKGAYLRILQKGGIHLKYNLPEDRHTLTWWGEYKVPGSTLIS